MSSRPSLIVFDLGGVLVRICRGWAEACAAAGLPVRAESDSFSASGARHEWAARHGRGEISSPDFFARVAESTGGLYTPDEVRRIHDAWLIDEYPGVLDLLNDLRSAGLATGVLSNTNHAHWVRLTPPGLGGTGEFAAAGMVDHPHASHLLGLLKPGEQIYREFERRVGYDGRGHEILFFDDLEENVAAAQSCGWRSEHIDHTGDTASQMRARLADHGLFI
ncbi:MAG: HAD family hydrolase [Phycisphaerales bacterium]